MSTSTSNLHNSNQQEFDAKRDEQVSPIGKDIDRTAKTATTFHPSEGDDTAKWKRLKGLQDETRWCRDNSTDVQRREARQVAQCFCSQMELPKRHKEHVIDLVDSVDDMRLYTRYEKAVVGAIMLVCHRDLGWWVEKDPTKVDDDTPTGPTVERDGREMTMFEAICNDCNITLQNAIDARDRFLGRK